MNLSNERRGFVNVKLLFVCLIIAGVGVWYFFLRDGSKGLPTLDDLKKENPFADPQPANQNTENVADPFGGTEPAPIPDDKQDTGKLVTIPERPAKIPEPKPVESPVTPAKKAPPTREAQLEGKWLAKWSVGAHNYTVEWDLKSDGSAKGKRTQNGNPIGQFAFKWYVVDDTLVTEVGKTKATFRHRPLHSDAFELTIVSGVQVAPGQSRVLNFNRMDSE